MTERRFPMTRFWLQVRTCGGRLLFAGLSVLAVLNFSHHGELRAQTLQEQATCADQARKTFQEDSAEWDRENKRLNIGGQTISLDYGSHYNTKINHCLMLITWNRLLPNGRTATTEQLYDAIERHFFAGYIWSSGAGRMGQAGVLLCQLTPFHEETKFCNSEDGV
jgi:hypothetical protein